MERILTCGDKKGAVFSRSINGSDIQQVAERFQRSVCLVGQYFFGQYLAQLYAFLVETVQIPEESLEHDLVLEVCEQCAERCRCQHVAGDDA